MRTGIWRWVALAALAGWAGLVQASSDAGGVKFAETIESQGKKLVLNGAGVRYKVVVKVYAAGLYLTQKADTPEAVFATPGPKRMDVTMLRDIESAELGKLFARGVGDNMDKAAFSKLVPDVMRMSQLFSDCKKLSVGDTFSIEWVPGTGTLIHVKKCFDQAKPFPSQDFFEALMRIWLGPVPADWKLKNALLGKPE